MGCKGSAVLEYPVNDVFNIFVKAAKRDFPNFNEDNAVGCKLEKTMSNFANPVKCTVEITKYVRNEKYEVTTTTANSTCVSTYTFSEGKNNTTLIKLEEEQTTSNFMSQMTLIIQRMLAKKQFKEGFNAFIDGIDTELKRKQANLNRSKPKND